jgi:hypothetical protein
MTDVSVSIETERIETLTKYALYYASHWGGMNFSEQLAQHPQQGMKVTILSVRISIPIIL